jgi:hypothetical protein
MPACLQVQAKPKPQEDFQTPAHKFVGFGHYSAAIL